MNASLESVVWELTLACNLQCAYCGSAAGAPRRQELSGSESLCLAEDLKLLKPLRVSLMGGEPLLVSHAIEVLASLASGGIRTDIVTNGELLTRDTAYRLREAGAYGVSLSLDGPAMVHDTLRRKSGQFETVSRAAEWVQEAGLPLGIITHVNRINFEHLQALYEILCAWHADAWQVQLTEPTAGRASNILITPKMLHGLHDFVAEKQREDLLHLYIADNVGYFHPLDPQLRAGRGPRRPWLGCQAGLSTLGISSDGGVRGCMSLPDSFNEGNVRERSIVDIWNDDTLFAFNRKGHQSFGACASCVFEKVCRGGCAGFSYWAVGKVGAMPLCRVTPLP